MAIDGAESGVFYDDAQSQQALYRSYFNRKKIPAKHYDVLVDDNKIRILVRHPKVKAAIYDVFQSIGSVRRGLSCSQETQGDEEAQHIDFSGATALDVFKRIFDPEVLYRGGLSDDTLKDCDDHELNLLRIHIFDIYGDLLSWQGAAESLIAAMAGHNREELLEAYLKASRAIKLNSSPRGTLDLTPYRRFARFRQTTNTDHEYRCFYLDLLFFLSPLPREITWRFLENEKCWEMSITRANSLRILRKAFKEEGFILLPEGRLLFLPRDVLEKNKLLSFVIDTHPRMKDVFTKRIADVKSVVDKFIDQGQPGDAIWITVFSKTKKINLTDDHSKDKKTIVEFFEKLEKRKPKEEKTLYEAVADELDELATLKDFVISSTVVTNDDSDLDSIFTNLRRTQPKRTNLWDSIYWAPPTRLLKKDDFKSIPEFLVKNHSQGAAQFKQQKTQKKYLLYTNTLSMAEELIDPKQPFEIDGKKFNVSPPEDEESSYEDSFNIPHVAYVPRLKKVKAAAASASSAPPPSASTESTLEWLIKSFNKKWW